MPVKKALTDKERLFRRLKNYYFALYEVEQEISLINCSKKPVISVDEYDYISNLRLNQQELQTKIQNLLNESQN